MNVFSAWQKRGPGLLPRRLQYRSMNFTGQKGEDSSPGITMSKGRLLVLCLKWVIVISMEWFFPPDFEESDVILRNYGSVTRAPIAASLTDAKETIEGCEKHG